MIFTTSMPLGEICDFSGDSKKPKKYHSPDFLAWNQWSFHLKQVFMFGRFRIDPGGFWVTFQYSSLMWPTTRWFNSWPFYPRSLEVTNNPLKGHFFPSQKGHKESPGRCLFILHVISRITRRMHSTAPTPWNTAKINLELLACMDGKPREVLKGTIAEVEGLTHLKTGHVKFVEMMPTSQTESSTETLLAEFSLDIKLRHRENTLRIFVFVTFPPIFPKKQWLKNTPS